MTACKTLWNQDQIWGSVTTNAMEQRGHCLRSDDVTSAGGEKFGI